jgi:hypothetical protein
VAAELVWGITYRVGVDRLKTAMQRLEPVVARGRTHADRNQAVSQRGEQMQPGMSAVRGSAVVDLDKDGSRRIGDRFSTARTRDTDPQRTVDSAQADVRSCHGSAVEAVRP